MHIMHVHYNNRVNNTLIITKTHMLKYYRPRMLQIGPGQFRMNRPVSLVLAEQLHDIWYYSCKAHAQKYACIHAR
jgi:hypothetical protein